ncbi:unnamed protein product [Paramecium sonneborni]|uniref:Uncharacterized protein n=1 Tax=Paramecium sonneborni TaxID=65129 RepID=A0A8S1MFG1_9CILI|nr:unnamed protein product [Paramecium sonneborni]
MQHKPSLFFQCQLYVAELSEPISLLEFTSEDVPNKFSSEQLSNSLNQISDHKPKISLQDDKINPYKSNWANTLLNKQFKVEVTCQGTKWIIKKVCEDEPQKSIVSSLPNLPKSIESQEKLLSKTNSKLKKIRFNKFFVDKHRQYALTPNGFPI